jgi:hypothetical protein
MWALWTGQVVVLVVLCLSLTGRRRHWARLVSHPQKHVRSKRDIAKSNRVTGPPLKAEQQLDAIPAKGLARCLGVQTAGLDFSLVFDRPLKGKQHLDQIIDRASARHSASKLESILVWRPALLCGRKHLPLHLGFKPFEWGPGRHIRILAHALWSLEQAPLVLSSIEFSGVSVCHGALGVRLESSLEVFGLQRGPRQVPPGGGS